MARDYYIKNFVLVDTPYDFVPGPDILATSTRISQLIQQLIDNQLIQSLNLIDENILTENDTVVKARYAGEQPSASLFGDNDEFVTISVPSGCTIVGVKVEGVPGNTDDSNRRTIVFEGDGLPGNTSIADIMIPGIIKSALTTSFGPPSTGSPWTIDFGASGDVEIVGVALTSTHNISLRFNQLNTLTDRHLLQFLW